MKNSKNNKIEKDYKKWPTYPTPPMGTRRGGLLLMGVAYLTVAAIYVAYLVNISSQMDVTRFTVISILFVLFVLSTILYLRAFEHFGKRLASILLQIALATAIIILGKGNDSLPILYFVIVPMIFLAFNLYLSSALLFLALCAMFLANLLTVGLHEALGNLFPYGGGFAFFAVVSTALVQQQKERQRAEQLLNELEEAHKQLHTYALKVEDLAVAEERNRIARDIHDSLGHYLTAMTMQLQAAAKLIEIHPERAVETIGKIEKMARDSLAELRRAVAALRDSPLDSMSLSDALAEMVQNLKSSGIAAELKESGNEQTLSTQIKTALYRAAQEGMTNVSKHAKASSVVVSLTYEPGLIGLEISDDGVGRQHDNKEGYGLLGLRERVTLLGGSLEAGDKPHGGFRLFVSIPYDKQISGQTHE